MRFMKLLFRLVIFIVLVLPGTSLFAQTPEDVIRFSFFRPSGTARYLAIGGTMGSLGGDITAANTNPAGLGFYKTGEALIGFNFDRNNLNALYRNQKTPSAISAVLTGPIGLIFTNPENKYKQSSSAFSISLNQVASFKKEIQFTGLNNFSSYSEQFAEEFANSGFSINDVLTSNSPLPYTAAPGLNTFLIDTVTINGNTVVRGAAENILDAGEALRQDYYTASKGGIYELSFAAAHNDNKHFLLGAAVGIPILHQKTNTIFYEQDTSSNTGNGFSNSRFDDQFTTQGIGINLKIGAIYRPVQYVRLGLAAQTPSFYSLTDKRETNIYTELETPSGNIERFSETSKTFTNGQKGEASYVHQTPWKITASGAYVFREVQNTKEQKGFISADISYVNYRGGRFRSGEDSTPSNVKAYYDQLKQVIQDDYKGALQASLGGEVKFNIIMARAGIAYLGNPYKDPALKAKQLIYSAGLGYRNKGMFFDIAFTYANETGALVPYRLVNRANTIASFDNNRLNFAATIGVKF